MAKAAKAAPKKEAAREGGSIMKGDHQYGVAKYKDGEGKTVTTVSNGDAIAVAMTGVQAEDLEGICVVNDMTDMFNKHAGSRNFGHLRMIIGNSLRAKVKRGEKVKIGTQVIKTLDQSAKPYVKLKPVAAE